VIMRELSMGALNDGRGDATWRSSATWPRAAPRHRARCTEIPLLVRPGDTAVPLFDTATLHARLRSPGRRSEVHDLPDAVVSSAYVTGTGSWKDAAP